MSQDDSSEPHADDGTVDAAVEDGTGEHSTDERPATREAGEGDTGTGSAADESPGYDTGYDSTADPHAPDLGGDAENVRYRRLPNELTSAESVAQLLETIRRYGWAPALLTLSVYGVARGVFEFVTDPTAIAQGYAVSAWPLALAINVVYGVFLGGFTLFLYFGVIGAFAGFFSSEHAMETEMFKVGAYLLVLFVPLLAAGAVVVATIPPSVATVGGEGTQAVIEAQRAVADTIQMRAVGTLLSAGWILVGFALLPVVGELYDIDTRASVVSVLPPTLVAVVATSLV